jgi:hypothetical protein
MEKLNIITGTAISYGLHENRKALDLLFKSIEDNGFFFREKSLGSSILEVRKTMEILGLAGDAIYNHYENYILPIRSSIQLKYLKKENISYKVLNINNVLCCNFLKRHSCQNESAKIAEQQEMEFAKKLNRVHEEEYFQALADSSVFEVFNISIADLDNKLSEIISFFKK